MGETVSVKVLDIDRDRQRISLGLKQTQEDPWRRVLDEYRPGDVLEGKVTKVVAFGAFVEIVPGVEGLVHISELAEHHVENPSEVVSPGDQAWVRILEIDEKRRRISLSVKRAEPQNLPLRDLMPPELDRRGREATPDEVPDLDVSEEVFPEPPPQPEGEQEAQGAKRPPNRPRRTRAPDRRAVAPPPDINRHQPVASTEKVENVHGRPMRTVVCGVWTTRSPNVWRDRFRDAHRIEPLGRRGARRRLALPDLVAVEQQHAGAVPASSRATASPAKLAPQISTSHSPPTACVPRRAWSVASARRRGYQAVAGDAQASRGS